MLELIILSMTASLNLLLGIVVYIKNPRSLTNKLFLLLTGSFALWSIVNYMSVHPAAFSQLTWVRLVLFCGALLNMSVFLTFLAFPSSLASKSFRSKAKITFLSTLAIMVLTLTPLVFKDLRLVNGEPQPVPNLGIGLFLLHTITLIGASIVVIIKKYRTAVGRLKNQLRLVLFGTVGTFALILISNFLLVVIFNFTLLVPLGPAFTLIFSGSFAYAIIKHRLFDIRAAIARMLGYLLSLGTIALIYSGVVFGLAERFGDYAASTGALQRAFYIGCAVMTSFFYPPLKRFFDKATNRVFFQDSYDTQVLLDSLNKILVSNIDLSALLNKTSNLIVTMLNSEYCVFIINKTSYTSSRVLGDRHIKISEEALQEINNSAGDIHYKIIMIDELVEDKKHEPLYNLLQAKNAAVLVRLATSLHSGTEALGYLVLGSKKSGNSYSSQDANVIGIVTNELVIAIENSLRFEEIENFNLTLQEKISEATRTMRKNNEKLRTLDETKDDFISMASHQLRTPLTSVKGYLSMVLEGDAGKLNDMQRKLLSQAFISSQRMVFLIADLLNVSRLKTGKFIIEPKPTNLSEVVEDEIVQLTETAVGRGLQLKYKKPDSFPTLMLDETKVRQVVMNFIDNAIYYTPSGGSIDVELRETDESVEFRVHDTGIGVPSSERHRLFTKFYRAGNARKARPDGTGLGLFMAKKVIVAQGGSIIFSSQEGKGSTFGFAFNKARLLVSESLPKATLQHTK